MQETKDFPSWIAFQTWKEEEEESAFCHFVQPTGGKANENGSYIAS